MFDIQIAENTHVRTLQHRASSADNFPFLPLLSGHLPCRVLSAIPLMSEKSPNSERSGMNAVSSFYPIISRVVAVMVSVAVALMMVPTEAFADVEPPNKTKDLLEMIIRGINFNYSHIEAFSAKFDREVDRPWAVKFKSNLEAKNGNKAGNIKIDVKAHSLVSGSIYGRGVCLRWETHAPKTILVFSDEIFTQYHPTGEIAWRRRPTEMAPVNTPWDPRNVGVLGDNRLLTQVIRGYTERKPLFTRLSGVVSDT